MTADEQPQQGPEGAVDLSDAAPAPEDQVRMPVDSTTITTFLNMRYGVLEMPDGSCMLQFAHRDESHAYQFPMTPQDRKKLGPMINGTSVKPATPAEMAMLAAQRDAQARKG